MCLENLNLRENNDLGKQSLSILGLKHFKKLNMSKCGLKIFPDGLENCISLEDLELWGNKNLDKQPFSITRLKNLKNLM